MALSLPKFERPPVVETILNLQFQSIPEFTAAHIGYFWKQAISDDLDDWRESKIYEQPRLDDTIEDFGPGPVFQMPTFRVEQHIPKVRLQFEHPNEDRMIQIQNSRLIYNWRKKQSSYPTFKTLKPEFDRIFRRFRTYVEAEFSAIIPKMWEVVYLNHIPKGEMWNSVADWGSIISGILTPSCEPSVDPKLETMGASWRWLLGEGRGRLQASLQHAKSIGADEREVMQLQFTARGPIDETKTMEDGFALGHEVIVGTFYGMTSDLAHAEWGEIQ